MARKARQKVAPTPLVNKVPIKLDDHEIQLITQAENNLAQARNQLFTSDLVVKGLYFDLSMKYGVFVSPYSNKELKNGILWVEVNEDFSGVNPLTGGEFPSESGSGDEQGDQGDQGDQGKQEEQDQAVD